MATPSLSRSAKLFQERRVSAGRTTRRLPSPRSDLERNRARQLPLSPPYPIAAVALRERGHEPDSGLTKSWPYGEEEILG